ARRLDRAPRGHRAARRRPGRAEARDPRQARPGEHHGARPLPGPRRHLPLARALLRATSPRAVGVTTPPRLPNVPICAPCRAFDTPVTDLRPVPGTGRVLT